MANNRQIDRIEISANGLISITTSNDFITQIVDESLAQYLINDLAGFIANDDNHNHDFIRKLADEHCKEVYK